MAKTVRIGVFIPNGAQTLDVACIDVLGSMSKEYVSAVPLLPSHVAQAAPSVTISYITTPALGDKVPLTSGMTIMATHAYTDPEVAPGKLDIVMVPGPAPTSVFEEGGLEWLRQQAAAEGVDILSVCTGILIVGAAGIADGKTVSGPRGMKDVLMKRHPKIRVVGDEYRWVRDGNLWSSGGVTNGNDLMAAYARSGTHWPQSMVELILMLVDVGDRKQIYNEGQTWFTLGMVWQLAKMWIGSFGARQKTKAV